jgi:hypothetical protein
MSTVYILWHVGQDFDEKGDDEDAKLLGVFSSNDTAQAWQEEARLLPGFRDAPDRFMIEPHELDKPEWTEGYVRVMLPHD